MKEKIKKIAKKILLIILLIFGGGMLAGIIQEEIEYGFLHGLVILAMAFGFIKIVGIDSLWRRKDNKAGDYGIKQEDIDNYNKENS